MNIITATTTDEAILAQVHHAKQALADAVAAELGKDTVCGERLVGVAQSVASSEALATAQIQYRNVLANKPENALAFLVDLLARGADDSWSGRRNDSRRSSFDAVCAWARDAAREVRS